MKYILLIFLIALAFLAPQRTVHRGSRTVVSGVNLNTNLVSFWKLGEASGTTRNDSIGTNHLTDVTAEVTQTSGKIGNAGQFGLAGTTILRRADNASLSPTSSFTFALWVNADVYPGAANYPAIFAKWGANKSYILNYDGDASRFSFGVSSDGSNQTVVSANTFGAPSTSTWYFIVAYFDDTANTIGISVNNGAFDTAAFTSNVFDSTENFELGVLVGVYFWQGKIDAVGFWSYKLPAAEITDLYNSGTGKEPAF